MASFQKYFAIPVSVYEHYKTFLNSRQLKRIHDIKINQLNINRAQEIKVKQKIKKVDKKKPSSEQVNITVSEENNNTQPNSKHVSPKHASPSQPRTSSPISNNRPPLPNIPSTPNSTINLMEFSSSPLPPPLAPSFSSSSTPPRARPPLTPRRTRTSTRGRGRGGRGSRRTGANSTVDIASPPESVSSPPAGGNNIDRSSIHVSPPNKSVDRSFVSYSPPKGTEADYIAYSPPQVISPQSLHETITHLPSLDKRKQLTIASAGGVNISPKKPARRRLEFSNMMTHHYIPPKPSPKKKSPIKVVQSLVERGSSPMAKSVSHINTQTDYTPEKLTRTIQTSVGKSLSKKKSPEKESTIPLTRLPETIRRMALELKSVPSPHNTRSRTRQLTKSLFEELPLTPAVNVEEEENDEVFITSASSSPPTKTFFKPPMPRQRARTTTKKSTPRKNDTVKRRSNNLGKEIDLYVQQQRTPGLSGVKNIARDIEKSNTLVRARKLRNSDHDDGLFVRMV